MSILKTKLWEILVPNNCDIAKHFEWDDNISRMIGGVSVLRPIKGKYFNQKEIESEEMVPVRIAANSMDMLRVMEFTKEFYNQQQVMCYKISDEVIFI